MKNSNALAFFAESAKKDSSHLSVKFNSKNDHTEQDSAFILRYANRTTVICDLGSGPGLIINRISDSVGHVVAVEPFKEFTDQINKKSNVTICNETIDAFDATDLFDMVTFFATAHYFNTTEIRTVYQKCYRLLKPEGILIVKNQFGVQEDVVVSGYSEELKAEYYAEYRYLPKEQEILASVGFVDFEVVDIYPPEYNRWKNTHFYAIVCKRANSAPSSVAGDLVR